MKYAAVMIPTLCRFEHFVALIDSLLKNKGVEHTVLYVALDYPTKSSQWPGYRKLLEYIPSITGFKEVYLIKRSENYGIPRNGQDLRKVVEKEHDRVIFSEDDNVFAPNFLEYINGGLARFEHDGRVAMICGYRHFYPLVFENNNYFLQNSEFSAWGYGYWVKKRDAIMEGVNYRYFRRIIRNPKKLYQACMRGWNHLKTIYACSGKQWNNRMKDVVISELLFYKDKYVVMPKVSKVRNIGWDGSGNIDSDSYLTDEHHNQELDQNETFEYLGRDTHIEDNARIYAKESYARDKKWHVFIRVVYRIIFGG